MKKSLNNLISLIFFSLLTSNLYAVLDIEITKGVETAVPIAVYPFEFKANQPDNSIQNNELSYVYKVVSDDLYRSGLFIPKIQAALASDTKLSQLPVKSLQGQDIEYIIRGKVIAQPFDRFTVEVELVNLYQLVDVTNLNDLERLASSSGNKPSEESYDKAIIFSKSYTVEKKHLRALSHHITDELFETLTGIKGIFSTKIAYVNVIWNKGQDRKYILEVADSDGFNPQRLLESSQPIMSPAWHPNGKEIAYVSFYGNRSKVNVVELATGNIRTITSFKGINGAPAWSPDGTKMALVLSKENYPKIYTVDLFNKTIKQITHGTAIDTEPRWDPNGQSLIFTSNRGGGPQIYRYTFANTKIQRLTYEGAYNARASFSPDGKKLIMIHRRDSKSGFKIAVQDLTTYNVDVLTESNMDESPSISANGQQIIYATKESNKGILAEVSIDGSVRIKRPATVGEVQEPAWSPFFS